MNSDSEKKLRWMLSQAEEQHKKERQEWLESCVRSNLQIQSLKEQVSTLQLQLKTPTKREKELEEALKSRGNADKVFKDTYKRHNSVLLEELEKCHESHKQTLMEMKKQHEDLKEEKVCMEADLRGRLEQQCKAFEEQVHQLQCQVNLKDRQYRELEQAKKKAIDKVTAERDEAIQMIETLQSQEIKTKEATAFDKRIAHQNFIHRTEKMRKAITDLNNDAKKAQKKISCLEETIKEKDKAIANKHKEYAIIGTEKTDLRKLLSREEECNALLRVQLSDATNSNKILNGKFLNANSERIEALEALKEADLKEQRQTKLITILKSKNDGMGPGLNELKDRVHKLETFQKRFLEDLQTCMPLLFDHNKLKSRVIALKELYIDKKHHNLLDKHTEAGYIHQIANLERRLCHCAKIHGTVKNMQLKHEKANAEFCQDKSFYIDTLNAKMKEMAQLKEELRETKERLTEATKPLRQRATSWIRKTILQSPRASPDVPEEALDNSQPPSLPEDVILSSPSPSSSKPHRCTDDDTASLVRPYDADGITPIDI